MVMAKAKCTQSIWDLKEQRFGELQQQTEYLITLTVVLESV